MTQGGVEVMMKMKSMRHTWTSSASSSSHTPSQGPKEAGRASADKGKAVGAHNKVQTTMTTLTVMVMMMMCKVEEVGHFTPNCLKNTLKPCMMNVCLNLIRTRTGQISSVQPRQTPVTVKTLTGKKQVGAQFGQKSKFLVRRLLELNSFELCESDDGTEWQVQDAQDAHQQDAATTTDTHGQNCASSLGCTAKRSSSNVNSQSDCSNVSQKFGLTANSAQTSTALVGAHVDPTVVNFVLDSGCTQHIFNGSRANFTNFSTRNQRICTANDKDGLSAGGVGDLPVTFTAEDDDELPVTLKNVLWAPSAISSLLSVSQAVKGGCTHGIDDEGAYLQLPAPGKEYVTLWAEEQQGLYIVPAKLQLAPPAVISLSADASTKSKSAPTKVFA
jgi:hypothetical protein